MLTKISVEFSGLVQPYSSVQINSENLTVQLLMLYQPRLELASFRCLRDLGTVLTACKPRKSLKIACSVRYSAVKAALFFLKDAMNVIQLAGRKKRYS